MSVNSMSELKEQYGLWKTPHTCEEEDIDLAAELQDAHTDRKSVV